MKITKNRIEKYIEFITTKIKILYKEKKFHYKNNKIKYMLEKNDSDELVIILSGLPRKGIKARYNYARTLKNIKLNKLFILDDLGYDKRGGWYLGKDKVFSTQEAVIELIKTVKNDLSIKKTSYAGSSKGGWAALYFGIQDPYSKIIVGSLQYNLGNYLMSMDSLRENTLPYIMGKNYNEADIIYLNKLLKETISNNHSNHNKIHLHYSDSEKNFEIHTKYLLEDLDRLNIDFDTDVAHYKRHAEVADYFPSYLIDKLSIK